MSRKLPKFKVGDVVRFKEGGGIDWEVVAEAPNLTFPGIQKLKLASGMSSRTLITTNERVALRSEVVK